MARAMPMKKPAMKVTAPPAMKVKVATPKAVVKAKVPMAPLFKAKK